MNDQDNIQITPEHAQIIAQTQIRQYQSFEKGVNDRANKKGKSEFSNGAFDLSISGATTYSAGFGIATGIRGLDFIIGNPGIAIAIASCLFLGLAWNALAKARLGDARLVLILTLLLGGAATEIYLTNWGGERIDRSTTLHLPK